MIPYKRIFIGTECNNRCLYCDAEKDARHPHLPFSEIVGLMSQNNGLENIEFYGGEPTLRDDFFDMVKAAGDGGYQRIKIVTNARLLSDIHTAVKTIESGCYFFEIKIHHYQPDIHDSITQARGSLQQTVGGIVNLRRINTLNQSPFSAFITLRVPLSKENFKELGNIVLFFIPYKVDRMMLSFDDPELDMARTIPHIQSAIDLSVLNRVWILTQGIPLCAMTGYEHHVSEICNPYHGEYDKFKACKKCIYDEVCPGVSKGRFDDSGIDGFRHVPLSEHIGDIRALRNE